MSLSQCRTTKHGVPSCVDDNDEAFARLWAEETMAFENAISGCATTTAHVKLHMCGVTPHPLLYFTSLLELCRLWKTAQRSWELYLVLVPWH